LALVAAVAAVGAVGASGCGGNDQAGGSKGGSGGSEAALKQGDTFHVGYAASQTGRLAIFEQPLIQGLKAKVNQINSQGGIDGKVKIDLQISDAKSDPSTGGVVAQDLISHGAQFLITACDADASLPASQLAQKAKIPVMNSCGSGSSLPQQVGDYQFMNVFGTDVEGKAMGELAKNQGYKSAYIMTSHDIEYTDSMMKSATQTLKGVGVKVLGTQEFSLDQPRYTAQATTIASANPDVVITSMFLPASVTFLKNLRAAGYTGPVIGPDGQSGPETFGAGAAANDLYVITFAYPSDDPAGHATKAFYELYKKDHKGEPNVMAVLGGDVACLIDYAVKTANSTDPTKVRDALGGAEKVACPSGLITYKGRNGLPKKDVVILKTNVPTKSFEFMKRFFPASGEVG
jgi:branched-chain amino acid transport system substrate-binding protein